MVVNNQMKGLKTFISDLRNLKEKDEEKRVNIELAKIRAKFQSSTLSAYDRKKYVSKLLYIYMLGYPISFGHLEAVKLLTAAKYSEKQIGYLAVALLLNENHDLIRLVINSIKKDLLSLDSYKNSIALHAVANFGGREMCETVYPEVQQLLMSAATENIVRQKAALSLLHIYRKFPDIMDPDLREPIIMLLDDDDLNVSLAVSTFVLLIVCREPSLHNLVCKKAIHKLKLIVSGRGYSSDYVYYSVPCPWLQVNLCRILLACHKEVIDDSTKRTLIHVLDRMLSIFDDIKETQHLNAINAILFEAIKLAFAIDDSGSLYQKCMNCLGKMIADKEANVRYLAFDTTAYLISCGHHIPSLKTHKELILSSLRYKDVSLRKKSLELLYMMCDAENSKSVVDDLLMYLPYLDSVSQEDLISKVASLTEIYADDYKWYVDVNLQLLRVAGRSVNDDVWHQFVRVIVNNESTQQYSVRRLFKLLQSDSTHECLVRSGCYLLGEYGYLIADEPESGPLQQFLTVYKKLHASSTRTKVLLLTVLLKLSNLQPDLQKRVASVFKQYSVSLNTEIQQRACEYLQLLSLPSDFLSIVCEKVPVFTIPAKSQPSSFISKSDVSLTDSLNSVKEFDISSSLSGFYRLCWRDKGILYRDSQVQVGAVMEFHDSQGYLSLYFENRQKETFSSFSATLLRTFPNFQVDASFTDSIFSPDKQLQQRFSIDRLDGLFDPPILRISFLAGVMRSVNLLLPVVLSKFMLPTVFDGSTFFQRWGKMGLEREAQLTYGLNGVHSKLDERRLVKIILGLNWGLCPGIDMNPTNIVGAGILQVNAQNIGCLLRLEPNYQKNMIRLSIRSTNTTVANVLATNMQDILKNSFHSEA
ncbi:AP-2 adaptor complex subunit Alp3 [Schizosaccharomyces cryophilus OY26]|uniref:AP-2 complex subunit alpha n=1 Tax=Schizosaccharomyces cryophilus (strain OY26 / ATCC MYA-4695 / CBS 11777 / NBRC 106824 / NRRL Y48691) TaxID=653667 RepID=S9VMP4_SCHCR|nr:AP-2 adaptor complex subunit Alp3 [Schizosaccharomyces cryophilus OY26]EPY49243.1 AP-2 adaptor complex subunit Alp3 [Schizosaccharomyces cryophilus OY26]